MVQQLHSYCYSNDTATDACTNGKSSQTCFIKLYYKEQMISCPYELTEIKYLIILVYFVNSSITSSPTHNGKVSYK